VSTGKFPSAVVVHPNGQWVVVTNRDSGTLSIYQLDSLKGDLRTHSRIKVGKRPVAITLDSTGRYVYVRNEGPEGLRKFVLDGSNGKLTPAGKVDIGSVVDLVLDTKIQ
jgi:6-phosphogluconolactonase (cycloisomerase 2 family)